MHMNGSAANGSGLLLPARLPEIAQEQGIKQKKPESGHRSTLQRSHRPDGKKYPDESPLVKFNRVW